MKRPTMYDDGVCRVAAEKLWERIKRDSGDDAADNEASIKSITEAIRYDDDGYAIARHLEHDGWDPDAQMVDTLDSAFSEKLRACETETSKWVDENGIKPEFAVGSSVRFKDRSTRKSHVGEVTKVELDQARYWLFCEELGHVREGVGTHAIVLNYEDVEALEEK